MRNRSLFVLVALFGLALTSAARAADVDGKWKWSFGQGDQAREMVLTLKADGEKLTGALGGGRGEPTQISDGVIKGAELSFTVTRERNGQKMTTKYAGKLDGDTIKGTVEMAGRDGGEARKRDWEAKRVKEDKK